MRLLIPVLCAALTACHTAHVAPRPDAKVISLHAESDFALTADPDATQWKDTPAVVIDSSQFGKPMPGYRTEVRSRWTGRYLYLLYSCPYRQLYLHPRPVMTDKKTARLWEWDVAEAFIGTDVKHTNRYWEFEMSPQGEWIALGVDTSHWRSDNSLGPGFGLEVKSRVNTDRKLWYGEMRVPLDKIGIRSPREGTELRINLFRIEGPPPRRNYLAWQPTMQWSFHEPDAFGRLVLE